MASRRDQLNAYTFARKRMVAAFLRPSATGSDEGALRPVRAIVPSLVVAALLLAGFGGWGLIKPSAPLGWNALRTNVLVGSESTTRYVMLGTEKKPVLYPVLNLASAKLLLDPSKFAVVKVDESVLDSVKRHGPTIGIPYAPDRLPTAADAGTRKLWSVCEQPGRGADPQKATFVFAERDDHLVDGRGRLTGDQALFVKGPNGLYLVDASGTAYPLDTAAASDNDPGLLVRTLFGDGAKPQQVTSDWLQTFNQGQSIQFPDIQGIGESAGVSSLKPDVDHVGTVLTAPSGDHQQLYVVLRHKVARISPLVAKLLLSLPAATGLYDTPQPAARPVPTSAVPSNSPYFGGNGWPQQMPRQADNATHSTLCNVYRGELDHSRPELSVWTGPHYPAGIVSNGATAYVTPGSGLLYRQITGGATGGTVYLLTDTGLRYDVPGGQADQDTADARTLLGYGQVQPVPVPEVWSAFLPTGPRLDPATAAQQQGS